MSALAATATRLAFLADDTDVGDETHKGGPLALLVIIVLCVVCFFLFRSMSRHLRKVRDQFPDTTDATAGGEPGGEAPAERAAAPAESTNAAPGSTRPAPKSRARQDDPAPR